MQTHFTPGPSSKRWLSVYIMFICINKSELLTRYPRKYKLGKIRLVYTADMRNTRSKVQVKSFRLLKKILRFFLKDRDNTGNIFVQLNVALQVESVVGRITTHFKHCHAKNLFRCKFKKIGSKWIDVSSTCCATCCFNLQQRNFDVWQFLTWVVNTCNNAFQLATPECSVCKLKQFVARITSL